MLQVFRAFFYGFAIILGVCGRRARVVPPVGLPVQAPARVLLPSGGVATARHSAAAAVGLPRHAATHAKLCSSSTSSLCGSTGAKLSQLIRGDTERVPVAAFPWEDDDPYSKCTALRVQVGLQFSKSILETLNNLADNADTETIEGLHALMLDVVLALRRQQAGWRYGSVNRFVYSSDDEGREASSQLQRWGIDGEAKWGDGDDWEKMDKNTPKGVTEYFVITMSVSFYGQILADEEDLKVRSASDLAKILDAVSGVQNDELMELDVQWIPEEDGDSLSQMELTMKFPELAML